MTTKLQEEMKTNQKMDLKMDFGINKNKNETAMTVQKNTTNADSQKNIDQEIAMNFGISVDKLRNNDEVKKVVVEGLTEEEMKNLDDEISGLRETIFKKSNNDEEVSEKLLDLSISLSSQMADKHNAIDRDLSSRTKLVNNNEITQSLNDLTNISKLAGASGAYGKTSYLDKIFFFLKKTKREHEMKNETIEDKINIVVEDLKEKRDQQKELMENARKRIVDLNEFNKEVNRTIYVCKELLEDIIDKRIFYAEKAALEENHSLLSLNYYKDFKAKEEAMIQLIEDLMDTRLSLNYHYNISSDMKSAYYSVFQTINRMLTWLIPEHRRNLIQYAATNTVMDAINLVEAVKKHADDLQRESTKQYKEVRLKAFELSTTPMRNLATLSESIDLIIKVTKEIQDKEEKVVELRNSAFEERQRMESKLKYYTIGKNGLKRNNNY